MAGMDKFQERVRQTAAEKEKYLQRLRKKPPRTLDQVVADLHDAVFAETDCLACANCCKSISPIFTQKDAARIAARLRMSPGDFVQQYLRYDEDGDMVLQQTPCPFLDAANACIIYDDRPKACREYPHTDARDFHKLLPLTAKNIRYCPAAFDIVARMMQVLP